MHAIGGAYRHETLAVRGPLLQVVSIGQVESAHVPVCLA
jgi:hypothetical protein